MENAVRMLPLGGDTRRFVALKPEPHIPGGGHVGLIATVEALAPVLTRTFERTSLLPALLAGSGDARLLVDLPTCPAWRRDGVRIAWHDPRSACRGEHAATRLGNRARRVRFDESGVHRGARPRTRQRPTRLAGRCAGPSQRRPRVGGTGAAGARARACGAPQRFRRRRLPRAPHAAGTDTNVQRDAPARSRSQQHRTASRARNHRTGIATLDAAGRQRAPLSSSLAHDEAA